MIADHPPRRSRNQDPITDERPDDELVTLARAGDELALASLLVRYRAFARRKASSYFLVGAGHDDVVQEAMIGLYKAVRDFDATMETSFHGFADLCISRQLMSAIKAATRHKHGPLNTYVSFSRPVVGDADDDRSLGDVFPASGGADPVEVVISGERVRALADYVDAVLSDLEIDVLRLYVDGKSYVEISEIVQRHTKVVDNALQRVKRKIDVHLRERELVR